MKIQTSELTDAALDWAVAKCEEKFFAEAGEKFKPSYSPSTNWSQGGPIIEREQLNLACLGEVWETWPNTGMSDDIYCKGPTPLVAAMRCYVASKLGDTIEIPEELL